MLVSYEMLTERNIDKLFAVAIIFGIIAMCSCTMAVSIFVRVVPGHAPEVDANCWVVTLRWVVGVTSIIVIFPAGFRR